MARDDRVLFEEVQIGYRNFEGRASAYNKEGDRNFVIWLDDQTAADLTRDGWNVRQKKTGDEPRPYYLPVALNYTFKPHPTIIVITHKGRESYDEELCEMVDWYDILYVDVTIRAHNWAFNGKSGRKAYLKSLAVIVDEDAIEMKYEHLQDVRELERAPERYMLEGSQSPLALPAGETDDIVDAEIVEEPAY